MKKNMIKKYLTTLLVLMLIFVISSCDKEIEEPIKKFHLVKFTVAGGTGGTISASIQGEGERPVSHYALIREGRDLIFSASPYIGNKVESWTINGENQGREGENQFGPLKLLDDLEITVRFTVGEYSKINPVSRFAKYNLKDVNVFTEGDESYEVGSFFQWGRNIAFNNSPSYSPPVRSGFVEVSNGQAVVSDTFFTATTEITWFDTSKFEYENLTWAKIVNSVNNAPTEYVGNNNGDPCPQGYHLPTYEEFAVLWTGTRAIAQTAKNILENVDFGDENGVMSLRSDYYSISSSKILALRFKGSTHLSAYKYEVLQHIPNATWYIKITTKPLSNNNLEVEDLVNLDWNNSETIYFPLRGQRSFSSGNMTSYASGWGFYWSDFVNRNNYATIRRMSLSRNHIYVDYRGGTNGYAIRCIRNDIDYFPE